MVLSRAGGSTCDGPLQWNTGVSDSRTRPPLSSRESREPQPAPELLPAAVGRRSGGPVAVAGTAAPCTLLLLNRAPAHQRRPLCCCWPARNVRFAGSRFLSLRWGGAGTTLLSARSPSTTPQPVGGIRVECPPDRLLSSCHCAGATAQGRRSGWDRGFDRSAGPTLRLRAAARGLAGRPVAVAAGGSGLEDRL